jgi:hypothetical protein
MRGLGWTLGVALTAMAVAPTALAATTHDYELRVLSSPPSMVTGGDALVQLTIHGTCRCTRPCSCATARTSRRR